MSKVSVQLNNLSPQQVQKHDAVGICRQLLQFRSITPVDAGCQKWIAKLLTDIGFSVKHLPVNGVSNLIAEIGESGPRLAFCGHTDVVPPGALQDWLEDPFAGSIKDGMLFGRGVCDMKGGIAAMLAAALDFYGQHRNGHFRLQFLITSDEEGEAKYGSQEIVNYLLAQQRMPDYCIVGEPSSRKFSGDALTIGRRGAISGHIKVYGKLGHVAYPTAADNAIHKANKVLSLLTGYTWDEGSTDFPGTSLQVTYINSGNFTDNLVPNFCEIRFNVRYSHRYRDADIKQIVADMLDSVSPDCDVEWERPCAPYFNDQNGEHSLLNLTEKAIHEKTGNFPFLTSAGGASDGRFFAEAGAEVVELGLPNATIHQVNERVELTCLSQLQEIYAGILHLFHTQNAQAEE